MCELSERVLASSTNFADRVFPIISRKRVDFGGKRKSGRRKFYVRKRKEGKTKTEHSKADRMKEQKRKWKRKNNDTTRVFRRGNYFDPDARVMPIFFWD